MYKYILCITIYIIIVSCVLEQGEFDVKVTNAETCKGPKRNNCTQIKVKLENGSFLQYDAIVTQDMKTIRGKITGLLNKKELLRLHVKNVCDHIFFRPLFQAALKQSPDVCGVYKGHHKFKVDIKTVMVKFYGGTYIYGNWHFIASFWNDQCNMHCEVVYVTIIPKKSTSH